jgi:hypothetical protein
MPRVLDRPPPGLPVFQVFSEKNKKRKRKSIWWDLIADFQDQIILIFSIVEVGSFSSRTIKSSSLAACLS